MFRLAKVSLANRALVALLTIVITGFGLFSMTELKQELIPSIEFPASQIITVVPGASPEVMDEQVSLPLSQAVQDLADVESVVASSSSSISMISVSYRYGSDTDALKTSVSEAIAAIEANLPEGADPEIMSGSSSAIPVMFLTAASDTVTSTELSSVVAKNVVPTIEAVDGVRGATASGLEAERIVIAPTPAAMAQGISPITISEALKANGVTIPMGTVHRDGLDLPVQGGDPITQIDQLELIPLASPTDPGQIVTLGEIAEVTKQVEEATSITRTNGSEAVSIMVMATQDADIVAVSHGVQDAIGELNAELGDVNLAVIFDQGPFIEESIHHLAIKGGLGLVFAIIVILVFLFSVRSTLVTAVSIPLSVLVTFVGLHLGGHSLNMLTLGALTIAIGRIVDDSIVVIENIKRHLGYGKEKKEAILTGVREVVGAITSSTLTTVAVFLPIAVVGGLVGELFAPFALTVTIAMLSSLVVALTIVPVLSYWFLRPPVVTTDAETVRVEAEAKEHRSWLQRSYRPVLRGTQKHPVITLVASVVLLVITVGLTPLLKVDFLGDTGQNAMYVTQSFPAGTDLETISEGASQVEDALLGIDGVEEVMLTAGSGSGALSMLSSGSSATFIANTSKDADQAALQDEAKAAVEKVTAGEVSVSSGAEMGGFGGSVDVIVTAIDEANLATAATTVYEALQDAPDASEVSSDLAPAQPIVQVSVDRNAALEQGMTEVQVLGMVAGTLSPQSVGSVAMDGEQLSIYIDAGQVPSTPDELALTPLPTATGMVPLSDLATVTEETVPVSIARQEGELVATISLTPNEGELGALTAWVDTALGDLELPAGVHAKIGGLAEQQAESFAQLGLAMIVAIVIVFVLLVATFRSLIQPLILLVSIPFAATGALALLLVTGRPLGISALIGLLMLIGIVVTNAIVLIDLVNQYRDQGQSVADAVFNGARQRLRPILMTALATIFALTPMALGFLGSSGFISQDLAIVVIGGLVSSTALTLILVPVLYQLIEGRRERRDAAKAGGEVAVADADDAVVVADASGE
ncbi:hydrophobic/amphiphilic exporter-1, HAE1 family [Micrococcales bacterium KH10]|nr:hydrophobic/amphiphilic exporter-1, HAE1 family [Micrococcales bacterium KH10]